MPVFQKFNTRTQRWVKMERYYGKTKILDVKQREPKKPFRGVTKE